MFAKRAIEENDLKEEAIPVLWQIVKTQDAYKRQQAKGVLIARKIGMQTFSRDILPEPGAELRIVVELAPIKHKKVRKKLKTVRRRGGWLRASFQLFGEKHRKPKNFNAHIVAAGRRQARLRRWQPRLLSSWSSIVYEQKWMPLFQAQQSHSRATCSPA